MTASRSTIQLDLDHALAVALTLTRQAGALLRQWRQEEFCIENKGVIDLVTDCDRRSEELLVSGLSRAFPDHVIVAEEGSAQSGGIDAPVWYVDPLDGTTNFAHRMPWYAISVGLELRGERQVGVVYVPEADWAFTARRGGGAHHNGTPLTVSQTDTLDRSLVGTGFAYDRRTSPRNNLAEFGAVLLRSQGMRRIGVASLDAAMVAAGWLDAYWELQVKPWDICAGALLVEQAGGRVTGLAGEPFSSTAGAIVATNGQVHDELLQVLASVAPDSVRR